MNNEAEQIFLQDPGALARKGDAMSGTNQLNFEDVQDFSTVCRICATITDLVIPIFEGEGKDNNLGDKIQKHLPIQVLEDDRLPRVVCYQCASTLLAWHELVKCCVQADEALKARVAQLQGTPSTMVATKWSSSKKDTDKLFYESVSNVLTRYLESIHMDGEISSYVCHKCPNHTSLPDVTTLAEHIRTEHLCTESSSIQTFIQDNIAFEEMLDWGNSDRGANSDVEEIIIESEVLPNFFCPFCESIFSSTTRLVCHLNTHIEVCIDKGVTCCDNVFIDKNNFVQHLQEEHVNRLSKEVSNVCKTCGYQATDDEDLQCHISDQHSRGESTKKRTNASTKNQKCIPAVCPECNKTFANKYTMFVHMKRHNEAKQTFRCEQCDKTYSNQGNLTYHQKQTHAGILNHFCSYCGEAFPTRRARDTHLRIHTGLKPFKCTYCGKCFRAKNTLDRHLDMHLDVRKYACELCPKRFRKRTHLNYHISTHGKK